MLLERRFFCLQKAVIYSLIYICIYLLILTFCPCTRLSLLGELTVCFVTTGATASKLGFTPWEERESEQIMNHCKTKQSLFSPCGKSVSVKNVLIEEVFQGAVISVSPHPWLWEPGEWLEQQQPAESSDSRIRPTMESPLPANASALQMKPFIYRNKFGRVSFNHPREKLLSAPWSQSPIPAAQLRGSLYPGIWFAS